jgi:hypothetical protein
VTVDADVQPALSKVVGPPALLGLRPRFVERVVSYARLDERFAALSLFGRAASAGADEWDGVEFVASVPAGEIAGLLEELDRDRNLYGDSLVRLVLPQNGVAGGAFIRIVYQVSGLPLLVDWHLCPTSLGSRFADTKALFAHGTWPDRAKQFAALLQERPNPSAMKVSKWDAAYAALPGIVAEVARDRPQVVREAGRPMQSKLEAYTALSRRIGAFPAAYRDRLPPLFAYLSAARLMGH